MRIAMIGTRGVPARYGGFETCIEEIGYRLTDRGHDVVVYCRGGSGDETRLPSYRGMKLIHLPALKRRSLETLSHTALSVAHLLRHRTDVAIVFNAANAPFLPLVRLRGIPVATHVDGLEWQRAKWGRSGKRYYRVVESLSVRWSEALIADAVGIKDYYASEFGAEADLISYGAPVLSKVGSERLAELSLTAGEYHLVVARFEPENHVDVIVEGYAKSNADYPLVVVGSAPYADEHTKRIKSLGDSRVRFLGGVWDQELLDQLYAGSTTYLHGHSVGGTNPSLLRAIGAGAATIAFDVSFNREVLGDSGEFFADVEAVTRLVERSESNLTDTQARGLRARTRAAKYNWEEVASSYESLCAGLSSRRRTQKRPSGRRRKRQT